MLFNSELALVNRELIKKWPYLEPYKAHYSGQAHWVRILRRRIDRVMNVSAWLFKKLVLSEVVEFSGCACHVLGRTEDLFIVQSFPREFYDQKKVCPGEWQMQ